MTTTWRYAFAREPTTEGVWWSVREVYTDDEGRLSWTEAIAPGGDTVRELLNDLVLMDLALGHAILDLTLSEPKLVSGWPLPESSQA